MPLRLRRSCSLMSVDPPVVKKPAMEDGCDDWGCHISPDVYEFEDLKHSQEVLETFDQLRKKGLFTDVILSTSSREFPCHRAVLVAGILSKNIGELSLISVIMHICHL